MHTRQSSKFDACVHALHSLCFFSLVPRPSGKMVWYSEWHFLSDGVGTIHTSWLHWPSGTQAFWQLLHRMLYKSLRRPWSLLGQPRVSIFYLQFVVQKKKMIAYIKYITIIICSAIWFKLSDWRAAPCTQCDKEVIQNTRPTFLHLWEDRYKTTFLFHCVNIKMVKCPSTMLTVGALLWQWQWHALVNRSRSLFLLAPTMPVDDGVSVDCPQLPAMAQGLFVTWFLH